MRKFLSLRWLSACSPLLSFRRNNIQTVKCAVEFEGNLFDWRGRRFVVEPMGELDCVRDRPDMLPGRLETEGV